MKSVKRILAAALILLTVNLYLPRITIAEQHDSQAKTAITKHPPKILSTPEQEIPMVEGKKSKWTWVLLGVAAVGVLAAAGGGGGGGDREGEVSGSVTVSW